MPIFAMLGQRFHHLSSLAYSMDINNEIKYKDNNLFLVDLFGYLVVKNIAVMTAQQCFRDVPEGFLSAHFSNFMMSLI